MLRKLLLLFVILLVFCMCVTIAAYIYFGWKGLLALVAVLLGGAILTPFLFKKLMIRLFTFAVKAKGTVLKGAELQVHQITPSNPPDRCEEFEKHRELFGEIEGPAEEEDEEDETFDPEEHIAMTLKGDAECDWYLIDATVNPKESASTSSPFMLWEPGELMLAPPKLKIQFSSGNDDDDDEPGAEIYSVKVWKDGGFQDDDEYKYSGPQRLLLHAGVPRGRRKARLMYYFNPFGHLEFPIIDV